MTLVKGEVLVPTDTPAGSRDQRVAWAGWGNGYVLVVEPEYQGRVAYCNVLRGVALPGLWAKPEEELLERYERA